MAAADQSVQRHLEELTLIDEAGGWEAAVHGLSVDNWPARVDCGGHRAPAFLHVNLYAEKVAATPREFVYEFDCLV